MLSAIVSHVKVTLIVASVLSQFLEDPDKHRYGLELMKVTGLPSGTLYPVLARLEGAGWLTSGREEPESTVKGRPPRRYYRLTAVGAAAASRELETIQTQLSMKRPARPISAAIAWGHA